MIEFFRDVCELCRRYRKALAVLVAVCVVIVVVAAGILSYEVRQASFCDACHYMDPYVRHWQTSTHSEVECYRCHDYGAAALTVSAVKYLTGTYTSRPKANVHDESCLAADCHDTRTLEGTIEYLRGIRFDHGKHKNQILRGEKLRCTSCHNQVVQYDDDQQGHMVVNNKACFVCHFKDAGVGEAITGCNSCHGMPRKEVEHAGFIFNHEPYLKLGVACKKCHINIVSGDGSVPERVCYTCHVERSRQQVSRAELHDIHVTTNGIDCYRCHTDIEHGNFAMTSALEIQCENCHLRQHNLTKQMYMGIGGRDPVNMPSEMFAAQVSCSGCHTHLTPEGEIMAHQEKKEAGRQSCVTCHGDGYDLMFDNWLAGSQKVLTEYQQFITAAKNDFKSAAGSTKARTAVRETLSKMDFNYNFVREGHMPHNIRYALYLLNTSAEDFQAAMGEIQAGYRAPERGAGLKQENTCLTFCHDRTLKPEVVSYEGSDLPHQLHVQELQLGCAGCHSVTEHGKTEIDQTLCGECH